MLIPNHTVRMTRLSTSVSNLIRVISAFCFRKSIAYDMFVRFF